MGCSLTTAEKHNLFLPKQAITGIITDVLHAFTSGLLQFTLKNQTVHFYYSQLLQCTEPYTNVVMLIQKSAMLHNFIPAHVTKM